MRQLDGQWIEIVVMATRKAGSTCGRLPESLFSGLSGGFAHTLKGKKVDVFFSWKCNFIFKI